MGISNGLWLARMVARPRSSRGTAIVLPGRVLLVVLALFLLASVVLAIRARGPPPNPMTSEGTALDRTGTPLPLGTPLRTFIDGVDYSNHSLIANGLGSYSVLTAGNLVINGTIPEPSPIKEGANLGERFIYAASDFTASTDVFQETSTWSPGSTRTLTLHLGSAASTPQPLKIQGIVTQPARGGPGYVFLCNPGSNAVSLSDYYLQVDAPGTYFGGNLSLAGALAPGGLAVQNLTAALPVVPTGDALKLVYRNPAGAAASAGGADIVVDRVEFNATTGGTLTWQPGATIMGSAPAPGPGQILERSASCADTNSPSDFHLAIEPGLPAASPPIVTIVSPGVGQNVPGGQTFPVSWTMVDNVFHNSYLKVWVNVTYLGTTTPLLAGAAGSTTVDWRVPDLSAPGSVVSVEVLNPFGLRGVATQTFTIAPATPYSAYVAVLIVLVVAVFLFLAFRHARRQEGTGPPPRTSAPSPQARPPVPPGGLSGPAVPSAGTKVCPRCHTIVKERDEDCFYCGLHFPKLRS